MNPEFMRLAQEQMNRMSPADLAKMQRQMMSNPHLMDLASESMKNLSAEDFRNAAEHLKNVRPEEMSAMGDKMASATPGDIAAMRSGLDARTNYELNTAELLKKQGNDFHNQGKFKEALQKYAKAKENVKKLLSSKGRTLLLACSLNMMSCYLKTGQYEECIKEGSEVLAYDEQNVKALYRRGQAYKELSRFEDAISDLIKATVVSPEDETIADVLRDAKEKLNESGDAQISRGVIIEEIIEEVPSQSQKNGEVVLSEISVPQPREQNGCSTSQVDLHNDSLTVNSEYLSSLKDDPETIRSFQRFMSTTGGKSMAASSGFSNVGEMSPEMLETASNMIGKMSADDIQKMVKVASSFEGFDFKNIGAGTPPPNITPDILSAANDVIRKMPAEDLKRMQEMASNLTKSSTTSLDSAAESVVGDSGVGSSNSRGSSSAPTSPPWPSDIQQQMKDPAMRQMMATMVKNMSPDMMASMGEQFGFKISKEDAENAQKAMSSFTPEDLDRMMRWAGRAERVVSGARKTKRLLLGRPGMVIAVLMLLLALVLHWFGYIGSTT